MTEVGGPEEPFVTCTICKGAGCIVCYDTGQVKASNLARAREQVDDRWSTRDLMRLYRMVMHPSLLQRWRNRRARLAAERAWLAENEHPTRLDRADGAHRRPRTD